jgi:hypothetical protein
MLLYQLKWLPVLLILSPALQQVNLDLIFCDYFIISLFLPQPPFSNKFDDIPHESYYSAQQGTKMLKSGCEIFFLTFG